ncbi:tuftelin 1b isoform X1 [Periophthalmus magnuspinnatus]|uniref:tuftelin 1b isoform X1 n=2 Tax=Periophthalmus magnuspinnatus TaxID=409849 RepID=UPI00145B17A8|nr:tuftelin 1b isoform X1 [Periophthalmus magnuspinnatus]
MDSSGTRTRHGHEDIPTGRRRSLSERQNQERHVNKESSVTVVLPQKLAEKEGTHATTREEKVEVIKVYLESRPDTAESHQHNLRMLNDEVSQIQEVRYCLKTLREQMAARQNSNNNKYPTNGYRVNLPNVPPTITNGNTVIEEEVQAGDNQDETRQLREATKRLYAQLKEMEKRHQEEKQRLQAENDKHRARLREQSERLQKAEERSEERGQQVEELQRLLGNIQLESGILKDKMAAGEEELLQLKAEKKGGQDNKQRCTDLEKEVATLKEKIHHLDDMLKSQQRKVRHMIEQLQNSRTVLQERDRYICDLEEKVAFLEAENREMHDHMEYLMAGQDPPPLSTNDKKPEVVYSKPLTPTNQGNKALPFIKVIEIKS